MPHKESAVVAIVGMALTVALTWPLVSAPGSLGRTDSGDGRHGIWNVAWVAHALTTNPTGLFDANIFHPDPNTLAYSEANLIAGALAAPVWAATDNPYLAMNAVVMLSFTLSFWCAYGLVRHLSGSPAGAALSAIAFAFCPFIYSHFAHIQLLMSFGVPLVLWRLHRFVESGGWSEALALGAAMALTGLSCGYYGIFAGLAAAMGVMWFGIALGRWRTPAYWVRGALAGLLAAALVLPFFLPYLDIQAAGFERTLDDARLNSADWRAYLASPMALHAFMLPLLGSWKEVLFPGFLTIGLAVFAVVPSGGTAGPPQVRLARGVTGFYLSLAFLAAWASLGPDAGLYAVLHESIPVFALVRAPSRLGLLVTLALAVLAGAGFARLLAGRPGGLRRWITGGVLAVALAGSIVPSLNLVAAPAVPDAYRRLAVLPRAPVAEFPYFEAALERHRHTEYMLMSIQHWQPLVNGYSDHIPATAFEDMRRLSTFPGPDAWAALDAHGVRYVVIHWRSYDPADAARLRAAWPSIGPRLRPILDAPDVALYEVLSPAR